MRWSMVFYREPARALCLSKCDFSYSANQHLTSLRQETSMSDVTARAVQANSPSNDSTLFHQRRIAIDLIATARGRAIRCGLMAVYLHRPHPTKPDTDDIRATHLNLMKEQADAIARALALTQGKDPKGDVSQSILDWLAICSKHWPQQIDVFEKMNDIAKQLVSAAQHGSPALEQLLIKHEQFGSEAFFPAVTELCGGYWADLDEKHHSEISTAKTVSQTITATLKRLEYIGRHVRLVSLNASVEAARVGEEGKGLSVIAQEFKSLAEEIQQLASAARSEIATISEAQI